LVGALEIATRAPEEARAEDNEAEPFVGEAEANEFVPQDAVAVVAADAVTAVRTGQNQIQRIPRTPPGVLYNILYIYIYIYM